MRKLLFLLIGLMITGFNYVLAQDVGPTEVYGAANTPDGGKDVFVIEQPNNEENPLGNPLPNVSDNAKQLSGQNDTQKEDVVNDKEHISSNNINVSSEQTANLPQEDAELGKQFRNTLLEANGRVYDIQSYPEQDFMLMNNPAEPQTIYSPNVNN